MADSLSGPVRLLQPKGRANASSRPPISILRCQGCCKACRHLLHLQLRPLFSSEGPSVPPFSSNHGAERRNPPQRGEHCCLFASSYESSIQRAPKAKAPLVVLLPLLLPSHSPPPHCAGSSQWLVPASGSRRDAGSLMALPAELEKLISVQSSTQPSVFMSSPVRFSLGFRDLAEGFSLCKKDFFLPPPHLLDSETKDFPG